MTDKNIHGSSVILLWDTPYAPKRTVMKLLAFRIPATAPALMPKRIEGMSDKDSSVLNCLLVKPSAFLMPSSLWLLMIMVFIRSIMVSQMTARDTMIMTTQITLARVIVESSPLARAVQ